MPETVPGPSTSARQAGTSAVCVMVLGTSSGAGKSWLATALCRHYARLGLKVAPFKAQNMSNNARVVASLARPPRGAASDTQCTSVGAEIGSAQYFQALAARAEPDVCMNPLLLKPEADDHSQVVLMGRVSAELTAPPGASAVNTFGPPSRPHLTPCDRRTTSWSSKAQARPLSSSRSATCIAKNHTYNVRMIEFQWDEAKAAANLKKHQISFDEAKSIFFDEFGVQFFDDEHSSGEERFLMLGMSSSANLLIVCHCERDHGSTIRIISARKATKRESAFYRGVHR